MCTTPAAVHTLAAGAADEVHVAPMDEALHRYSAMRRSLEQAAKARQRLVLPGRKAN